METYIKTTSTFDSRIFGATDDSPKICSEKEEKYFLKCTQTVAQQNVSFMNFESEVPEATE